MAETPTTDTSLDALMGAIVEVMKSGVRPDVLEAQRILLQRLAQQGDVFPSRIPAPRNITEVGGYLNLLERAGALEMRMGAVASALGVAAPPPSTLASGAVPVGFVQVPNDRPAGPAQASIPPLLTVRADFHAPLQAARQAIAAAGGALPLRAPRATLPATQPGASSAGLDHMQVLATLGRVLEVFPGTVLVDAAVDPVAVARPETPPTQSLRLVARVLDGSTTVPEASWVALRASATAVVDDAPALRRYVEVAPPFEAAGWRHPEPLAPPSSSTSRGTLTTFVNLTGLVAGETTLGDELSLLYTPADIARSALAALTGRRWDGSAFA